MHLPVTIALRPSRRLALLLALAHGAALAVLFPLSLPLPIKGLLVASIAVSALLVLRRVRDPEVSALQLGRAGELTVEEKVGSRDTASVLPSTTVLPGLVVLLLRRGPRTLALPLLADATGRDAQRQLRLWLRWQA